MGSYLTKTIHHSKLRHDVIHHPPTYENRLTIKLVTEPKVTMQTRWIYRSYYDGTTWRSTMVPDTYNTWEMNTNIRTISERFFWPEYYEIRVNTDQGVVPVFTNPANHDKVLAKIRLDAKFTEIKRLGVHITIPEWDYSGFVIPDHYALYAGASLGCLLMTGVVMFVVSFTQ